MRLGHLNPTILSQVLKIVPYIQSNKLDFCTTCKFGKMHQFSFQPSQHKIEKPFEIVHSDLWGPSPHVCTK